MNDMREIPTQSAVTVAYMRTATADRATTGPGLERQRQACVQYAQALGRQVSATYTDIGVSGLSEHRPALDQLMLDLARGQIDHIVMADPDRLARSRELEQHLLQRIRKEGATISSPCDSRRQLTERRTWCHSPK